MNHDPSYVYILTNKNNTVFYIGVTSDLQQRMYVHKNQLADGFTKKYNINKLVYFEEFSNIKDAITREKQLKNWKREWKLDLIKSKNVDMKDLSTDW